MESVALLIVGLLAVVILVLLGIPIAFVLAMVGCAGIMILDGWESVLYTLGSYPISRVTTYSMIVVPLFIFMGELAVASGAAEDAPRCAITSTPSGSPGDARHRDRTQCAAVRTDTYVGCIRTARVTALIHLRKPNRLTTPLRRER